MSDELRAVEERVRRCRGGEDATDVYPVAGRIVEYACAALSADEMLLADAYLAEHPADDAEPVTEGWLQAIGFVRMQQSAAGNDLILRNEAGNCVTYYPARRGGLAGPFWGVASEWLPKPLRPATRGDVRRLLTALGVTSKPDPRAPAAR